MSTVPQSAAPGSDPPDDPIATASAAFEVSVMAEYAAISATRAAIVARATAARATEADPAEVAQVVGRTAALLAAAARIAVREAIASGGDQ